MIKSLRFKLLLLFIFSCYFASCHSKSNDTSIQPGPVDKTAENSLVNSFTWSVMDELYLWRDKIKEKPDSTISPKKFFEKIAFRKKDRWSLIVDNYQKLINEINGKSESFGFSLYPMLLEDKQSVVTVVMYVYPDSPAFRAGLKRGDIITTVNGESLKRTNYQKLLSLNSLSINLAELKGKSLRQQKKAISLSKSEVKSNPVHTSKIIERSGKKIAYLNYMSFIPEYDNQLESEFAKYQSENVTELVLDLRYNGGGDMHSAIKLGSMIAPSSALDQVFLKKIWNDVATEYFNETYSPDHKMLTEKFTKTKANLNLSRLYVITSKSTASASELIINNLRPYMEVITIGEKTHGKYVASSVFTDEKNHLDWAIMPIIFKVANAKGETDYEHGFLPTLKMKDDLFHALGDSEEACFKSAINHILGINEKISVNEFNLKYHKINEILDEQSIYLKNKIIDNETMKQLKMIR